MTTKTKNILANFCMFFSGFLCLKIIQIGINQIWLEIFLGGGVVFLALIISDKIRS